MKKVTLFLVCLSFQLGLLAQNPGWILPPLYKADMDDPYPPTSLPTVPTSEIGYYGDPATTVSNSMVDANGDLLFFIVDGMVYDKEGYSMRSLNDVINSNMGLIGTAEVAIAPVPGNCSQYYILLSGRKNYSNLSSKLPVVALLDLSVPSYHYPDRIGDLIYGTTIEDILP